MPAGSEKLTAARREEILDACAQLYEIMPFKKITHAMISQKTSFTRTSIYNYFRTKEEIFLALLEREYAEWVADLNALAALDMPREEFPSAFSALLEKRKCMLKLMSMNLYDIESGSSLQSLVSFKRVYHSSMLGVRDCLKKHRPDMSDNHPFQALVDKDSKCQHLPCFKIKSFSCVIIAKAVCDEILICAWDRIHLCKGSHSFSSNLDLILKTFRESFSLTESLPIVVDNNSALFKNGRKNA